MTILASASSTALLASVAGYVGDNLDAVLVVVGAAVAIPLAFYIGHLIAGMFPGARSRRR